MERLIVICASAGCVKVFFAPVATNIELLGCKLGRTGSVLGGKDSAASRPLRFARDRRSTDRPGFHMVLKRNEYFYSQLSRYPSLCNKNDKSSSQMMTSRMAV